MVITNRSKITSLLLILVVMAILAYLGSIYLPNDKISGSVSGECGEVANSDQEEKFTESTIDDNWQQIANNYYHYQLKIPANPTKIVKYRGQLRISYESPASSSPLLNTIDVSVIGLLNEPLEKTALRIADKELFEESVLNGNKAIKINYKNTYGSPAIVYKAILVRNSQNLNILIRTDIQDFDKYQSLFEESIQSFQFTNQNKLPKEITLSGKVTLHSGNCMPPSEGRDCGTKPIRNKVIIYPLFNNSLGAGDEKKPVAIKKVKPNIYGCYQIKLPPGTYSVFVDDKNGKGCSGSDGYGNMCGVTLYEEDVRYDASIDYAAY
jgi:hypothetical protein